MPCCCCIKSHRASKKRCYTANMVDNLISSSMRYTMLAMLTPFYHDTSDSDHKSAGF
jgi:hypothetical protein